MKKIISSLLALAMFVSVGVMMVGCDKVSGTYVNSEINYTIITKVEDGKIVETKTLSYDEYEKIAYVWSHIDNTKTWEEALNYEFDETQKEAFEEDLYNDDFYESTTTMTFKNGKVELKMASKETEYSTSLYELVYNCSYEVEDDTLHLTMLSEGLVPHDFDYSAVAFVTQDYTITEDGEILSGRYSSSYRDLEEDHVFDEDDVFNYENGYTYYYRETVFTEAK